MNRFFLNLIKGIIKTVFKILICNQNKCFSELSTVASQDTGKLSFIGLATPWAIYIVSEKNKTGNPGKY